jgi:HAE1 family hydrophobic/amphiphilic exporter-1
MFSKFFIEHPVFANVIAIITMVIGAVSLVDLPVEQYPAITPPTVRVSANYPGANADVVAKTVAAPIEQQVNGVENMLYMSSTSSSDGSYSLTVTFEIGTDLDEAQVLVQNRVAVAEPLLPEELKRQGVTVKKQTTNILMMIALTSPNGEYDSLFLSNYATLRMRDELSRVNGVGDVTVFGTGNYSMRVWLDPEKLKARNLTTQDVMSVIAEQNVQVAAGQIGQPPAPDSQNFQFTVTVLGRLQNVQQFENIVVKTGDQGRITYLKDVARIELGGQTYDQFNLRKGQSTGNMGIYQLPGANALNVYRDVKEALDRLSASFPAGMKYEIPLNTTKFVDASIHSVYETLIEAGVLVLIVILVFLQNWRAVLIPATTVPVTIIGAFAAVAALGFTVNMLTLFGLVLAIGIVVDDAIVIVENVAHHIEKGLPPKEATIKAMSEVLGPIIGITLVLMSVFLPSIFMGGITGQMYRQFSLTIAATALISAINAVTLKPAQCAAWMKPTTGKKNFFYRGFNAVYNFIENMYVAIIQFMMHQIVLVMLLFIGLVIGTGYWYTQIPTGFLPLEDQGYIFVSVQLPDASSQQRTKDVLKKIDDVLAKTDGVADWITIGGLSLIDRSNAPNVATLFVTLYDWDERLKAGHDLNSILGNLKKQLGSIQEAVIFPFPPPAIRGLGVRSGFQMQVQDRADVGLNELQQSVIEIVEAANQQSSLNGVNSNFRPGVPQIFVDVDRVKVKTLDIPLETVFSTLQAFLGSAYVNDFNKFGRTYQVRVQAEPQYRADIEDIAKLEVRNRQGQMIPMGTIAKVIKSFGPQNITRYNLYPAAAITGEPSFGNSSGDALQMMEQIADNNISTDTMGFEWTGMSYEEKRVGNQAVYIFMMAVLLVYLVLAAQYESWILPLAVILVVPTGLFGAIAAVSAFGLDNNLYTQIGIVLIIALASKNAILIVEFARDKHNEGQSIYDSIIEAARQRFRPILMTSFAFILGVVPLVTAQGAGAAGQRALGTAVFGGMIASTIFAVFFVPVFYVIFQHLSEWLTPKDQRPQPKEQLKLELQEVH